ncbi:PQQ-binding-like beta-propeller repeat protein, partial [Chloroflexota bacterium]
MKKSTLTNRILGTLLAFVLAAAMLPLGAFGADSRVEASPEAIYVANDYSTIQAAVNASSSDLADSPWPKYQHDLQNTGASPYVGPDIPELKWGFGGTRMYATRGPDGTIYVHQAYGWLYAIDADGTRKWARFSGQDRHSSFSPTVGNDGTVYVCAQSYRSPWLGHLYAINPDGTEKWTFTVEHFFTAAPAVGLDDTIYVISHGGNLHALDACGTQKWVLTTESYMEASPVIGPDGIIYVSDEYNKKLYAVNPDGTTKWAFDTDSAVRTPAAIGPDGTIYVASDKLYAVSPDGTEKWSLPIQTHMCLPTPVVGPDGTVYVNWDDDDYHLTGGGAYAINPDGTEKWNFYTGREPRSLNVGTDGTLLVSLDWDWVYAIAPDGTEKWSFYTDGAPGPAIIGPDDTIYVPLIHGGPAAGKLYAIDPDGTEKWIFNAGGEVSGSPTIGEGDILYLCSQGGELYAIDPNGMLKWSLETYPPIGISGGIPGHPTIRVDGTIYVCATNTLCAVNPDGTEKWRSSLGSQAWTSPVIGPDGTVYVGTHGWEGSWVSRLRAIDPDGIEKWSIVHEGICRFDPVINSDGTIYIG